MSGTASAIDDRVDGLVAAATERTGLSDLGPPGWREGLSIIVDSLETTPGVTAFGRDRVYGELVDALANRLRVFDYAAHHPEVREERIERPLIVLGLPRTGTTMTSCLLAEDRARRTLLHWEALESIPPPTTASLHDDPRCLAQQRALDALKAQLLEWKVPLIHWEDATSPTECVFLHGQDFRAFLWETSMPTPAYAEWLMAADMSETYAYETLVLQILQSRAPGIWSLKMPSHAVHIDALLAAFPDARIVWAHRDPYKATGSFLRMNQMARGAVLGEALDMGAVAANVVGQLDQHVRRLEAARERIGRDRMFDLHYADMMRDPIGQMRALYDWAGDAFTPETEAAMRRWLAENPQDRHGTSPYSLDEFGVSRTALEPVFADYVARYGIEPEGF